MLEGAAAGVFVSTITLLTHTVIHQPIPNAKARTALCLSASLGGSLKPLYDIFKEIWNTDIRKNL